MVLVRILGWLLILLAVIGGALGAVLIVSNRIPGGVLTWLYVVGPAIIGIVIGRAMARAGRRTDDYADQWTRNGAPKQ